MKTNLSEKIESNAVLSSVAGGQKQGYRAPSLKKLGRVALVTQATGNMGGSDGGNPPNQKTS